MGQTLRVWLNSLARHPGWMTDTRIFQSFYKLHLHFYYALKREQINITGLCKLPVRTYEFYYCLLSLHANNMHFKFFDRPTFETYLARKNVHFDHKLQSTQFTDGKGKSLNDRPSVKPGPLNANQISINPIKRVDSLRGNNIGTDLLLLMVSCKSIDMRIGFP